MKQHVRDSDHTDRVLSWEVMLALFWPSALILVWSGPFDLAFFGAALVILLWALSGFIVLSFVLAYATAKAWRSALSASVMPAMTLLAFLNLGFVWGTAIWSGDHLHLWIMRASYMREIAGVPPNHEPKLIYFPWGGFVIGHGVVYDESDEIARPEHERSAGWRSRAAGTELGCGIEEEPAGGHFYIVRTGC